ncbi:hypothetical protein HYU13_04995 [Candidatus Woesearchaeota archaeon]|nr:hypothetical protein [Candidatus Woesearchaeota archaeon]
MKNPLKPKRGEALPLNVIIIALIVLVVLVVIWLIFTGRIGVFSTGIKNAETNFPATEADITGIPVNPIAAAKKTGVIFPFIPFFSLKGIKRRLKFYENLFP